MHRQKTSFGPLRLLSAGVAALAVSCSNGPENPAAEMFVFDPAIPLGGRFVTGETSPQAIGFSLEVAGAELLGIDFVSRTRGYALAKAFASGALLLLRYDAESHAWKVVELPENVRASLREDPVTEGMVRVDAERVFVAITDARGVQSIELTEPDRFVYDEPYREVAGAGCKLLPYYSPAAGQLHSIAECHATRTLESWRWQRGVGTARQRVWPPNPLPFSLPEMHVLWRDFAGGITHSGYHSVTAVGCDGTECEKGELVYLASPLVAEGPERRPQQNRPGFVPAGIRQDESGSWLRYYDERDGSEQEARFLDGERPGLGVGSGFYPSPLGPRHFRVVRSWGAQTDALVLDVDADAHTVGKATDDFPVGVVTDPEQATVFAF